MFKPRQQLDEGNDNITQVEGRNELLSDRLYTYQLNDHKMEIKEIKENKEMKEMKERSKFELNK